MDDDLATLLAMARRRVFRRPAGVVRPDGTVVDDHGDPFVPPPPAERWCPVPDGIVDAVRAAAAPVVLAGPGVLADDAVPGLHALAAAGSLGVLNTWGAKGVFDWRSRHHLATVGLQALDFGRGGLDGADLVIATGVDEREAGTGWRRVPVVEVAPAMLDPLAERWGRPRHEIAFPPLRTDLARVTTAGWEAAGTPLMPTRVTRAYGEAVGAGGLVAADPGLAGYWVARTFPTAGVGGALVPAQGGAVGFAVAAALVARQHDPTRPVLAVVDALDDVHERLLDLAGRLGVPVAVEVWSPEGERLGADAHQRRLVRLLAEGGRTTLATDPTQLDRMIEVAGPVTAWSDDRPVSLPPASAATG